MNTRSTDSRIHPTAIIEDGAVIGEGCDIRAHAVITRFAILGDRVVVHPGAVIGGDPQYLKFDPGVTSFAKVGRGSVLREHVTINRAIFEGHATTVGEDCFIMAAGHVAHDCTVGQQVVMANNALLAGHVTVGDYAFIGGGSAVHQNVRIGESVMVGGLARISRDLAPFTMVAERNHVSGLNLLGLKRRGIVGPLITELKSAFREVYFGGTNPRQLAERAMASGQYTGADTQTFLRFFLTGKRGFARAGRSLDAAGE